MNLKKLLTFSITTLCLQAQAQTEMFDDFIYQSSSDTEFKNFGWIARTGGGGPGPEACTWSRNNISFLTEEDQNKTMRLNATTKGTGASTSQAEVYTSARSFLEGTFAARIRFTDSPFTGTIDKDQINQTFFIISPLAKDMDPDYSEVDFVEYLPNGGWGVSGPNFWMTTWETYQAEPWIQDSKSDNINTSFQGWHIVSCVIKNAEVKYYIDGELKATHTGKYYPESLMSLNFNLWFIAAGLNSSTEERSYIEDIDWVYHAKDTALTFEEINSKITEFRQNEVLSKSLDGKIRKGVISTLKTSNLKTYAVFPNPVNEVLKIKSSNLEIKQIKIYSASGSLLFETNSVGQLTEIPKSELSYKGLAIVKIISKKSTESYKVAII